MAESSSKEVYFLKQVASQKYNKDFAVNMVQVNNTLTSISKYLIVMQQGIDDLNRDMLEIMQDFIEDLIIIFNGGDLSSLDFEWGDLQYILQAIGTFFGFPAWSGTGSAFTPLQMAENFFNNFIVELLPDLGDIDFGALEQALQGVYVGDNVALQKIATWASGLIALIDVREKVGLWELFNTGIEVIDHFDELSSVEETEGWIWDELEGKESPGCAKFTSAGDYGVILSPKPVEIREGEKFNVKAWARGVGVDGEFSLGVQWIDASGIPMHYGDADVEATPSSSWFLMEGEVTAPAGAKYCRRRFSAHITTGTAYLDDVYFTGKATSLPQEWITNLVEALEALFDWIESLVDQLLGALGLPALGNLADKIADLSDEIEGWLGDTQDRAAELTNLISDLWSSPASVINTIPQSLVTGLSTTLSQIGDLFNGLAVTPANGVIGAIKDWLATLGGWQSHTDESTSSIQSQITTVQQVFSVRSNRPLWEGLDPTGESTIPFSALMRVPSHDHRYDKIAFGTTVWAQTEFTGVSGIGVDAARSVCGCIRIESPIERRQITFQAARSGSITGFYFDLYKMNEDGSFSLLYSSPNMAADILPTMTWHRATFPGVLFEQGDVIMVQFRGSAGASVAGVELPAPAFSFGFLPQQIGMIRDGTAPSTISAVDASSSYHGLTPYAQIGSDVGQLEVGRTFADTFNRASIGPAWMQIASDGSTDSLRISGGKVENWYTILGIQIATIVYTMPLSSDDMAVEFVTSGASSDGGVFIGSTATASNFASALVLNNKARILTAPNLTGTSTERAAVSGTFSGSARWKFTYTSADNTYRLYREDVLMTQWTDTGNVIAHGQGHRFWGIAIVNSTGASGSKIDEIAAYDVV